MSDLISENLNMIFTTPKGETVHALKDVNFTLKKGELLTVLGPSGCGKTTLLNITAGFIRPTSGKITLNSNEIDGPGVERGMVFQQGALFEWLTVAENVNFGLRMKKEDPEVTAKKVDEWLDIVGLKGFGNTPTYQLSGGMQQRVALARAIAPNPEVILLDEPFTSLDAHMARELRDEVVYLLRKTETTAIIVTHDQEEALSVCDVVSVLENGKVIQSATPQEIYLNPVSQTVANSVGDPNILKGYSVNGRVETSLGTFVSAYDGALDVSIRPECIELTLDSDGSYLVKECTFYGHDQVISFQNSKGEVFRARSLPNTIFESGDKVNINISEVTTFPSKA